MVLSTGMKIGLVAGVGALVLGLSLLGIVSSWYNDAVNLEEGVKAQWGENQNQYDNFWKTVKETAQVPEKYKEDFKQLLVAETSARYGEEGSKATFQWIQERQINFDAGQYQKIQNVIESGRNDFKRSQTDLLDRQRKFSVHLKSFWGRLGASWYDMPQQLHGKLAPTEDQDGDGKRTVLDYPIVTSKRTKAAFEAGEDEEVKVF